MKTSGFTLIELMITLALMTVLALTSVMIYQEPVLKTEQATAKLDLLNLVSYLEEYYEQHLTYDGVLLSALKYQPLSKHYKFNIVTATQKEYKIGAFPLTTRSEDQCGAFYLDQDGNRFISGSGSIDDCW